MAILTDSTKRLIAENCGMLLNDEKMVRFDKRVKPNRHCKKCLRDLGYEVAKSSGANFYPYIDYVLRDEA